MNLYVERNDLVEIGATCINHPTRTIFSCEDFITIPPIPIPKTVELSLNALQPKIVQLVLSTSAQAKESTSMKTEYILRLSVV